MVEMSLEQKRAVALARARAAASGVDLPPAIPDRGVFGQFTSGMTEGAANLLSLPNTVEIGLRSIGPAIGNAMGGDFDMPTESWLPDAGARFRSAADAMGSMTPETDDAAGRFARRVGQELGAGLIPALGVPAKMTALTSTVGSGIGAAIAQQAAPGNPYAELAGQLIGGFTPVGMANQIERAGMKVAAPSLDELRRAKSAAYTNVDNLGVQYTPQAMDQLINDMTTAGARINPMRHPKAASMLEEIKGLSGTSPTLTELDELRQTISRDLIKSSDGAERYWGFQFNNALDDFIAKAGPQAMVTGDAIEAATAINQARALNTRYRKAEDFGRQMTKADNAGGGSLQVRNKARQLLDNPARTRAYSPEELAALERIVKPSRGEEILRGVGKMAPGGSGLMTALGTGAVIHNPAMASVPIVAQIAKTVADKGAGNKAKQLAAMLAQGGKVDVPKITPNTEKVARALLMTQAANQNQPSEAIIRELLRVKGLN